MTLTVTEWTGLATSDVFDADGAELVLSSSQARVFLLPSRCRLPMHLMYAWFDNTADEAMTPGAPYKQVLQFYSGNLKFRHYGQRRVYDNCLLDRE